MTPFELLGPWAEALLRWLHVVAATVWLGAMYHFWRLGDRREAWLAHERGLHRVRAHGDAPPGRPGAATRFRWAAYVTWGAGFALLVLVYLAHPRLRLVDPAAATVGPGAAIALVLASLLLVYLLYEAVCRSALARRGDAALLTAVIVLLAAAAGLHAALLTPRAALLVNGAVAGTIMVANVAHVIVPGERRMLAALTAGEAPDPGLAARARQRLAHNEVLTLAVVAAMLAEHVPLPLGQLGSCLAFVLGILAGVVLRHPLVRARRRPDRICR
jgi:uncharacterized membrane protein